MAKRIKSNVSWNDLDLPAEQLEQLREIAAEVRLGSTLGRDFDFQEKLSRGLGVSAVFAGPGSRAKTLAAQVLASELDLELEHVDLASVVSKYIGETEKNLMRVFETAEDRGAILFFDEADALFGKRTEVKDSHGRYANIEVSYLLQRLESYNGLAVLATSSVQSLAPGLLRRFRFIVEFLQ